MATAQRGAAETPSATDASIPAVDDVLIGTQGWSYDQSDGLLYLAGLPKGERPAHHARRFPLVEIDSTCCGGTTGSRPSITSRRYPAR